MKEISLDFFTLREKAILRFERTAPHVTCVILVRRFVTQDKSHVRFGDRVLTLEFENIPLFVNFPEGRDNGSLRRHTAASLSKTCRALGAVAELMTVAEGQTRNIRECKT